MPIDQSDDADGAARKRPGLEQVIAAAVLLLLFAGAFLVMRPFVSALAWALVMAFALWPLYRFLVARLRGRRTLAALTMTSALALVLVVPTVVIVVNLTDDARDLAHATKRWVSDGPPASPQWLRSLPVVGARASVYWDELAQDADQLFKRIQASAEAQPVPPTPFEPVPSTQPATENKLARLLGGLFAWMRGWVPAAGLAIVEGVTQILLSVFLTFFIFRDGEALAHRLSISIERISGGRGLALLTVAGSTVRGVVYGILGTALVQGVMAGIGFLVAGVPGAVLLGLVTFCLSPLPVGPPLVWIPATIWLFHQDHTGWGIFMVIWGVLVSCVDNVVKPWIISQGSATPFILILFGVIGGALAFGFIGVFLGPTLLAVTYRMIEQWSRQTPGVDGMARPNAQATGMVLEAQGAS